MKKLIGMLAIVCMLMCTLVSYANEPPLENISWSVEKGVLTVSGTGKMPDFKTESSAPWSDKKDEVTKIVVEDGITHIGSLAFYGFTKAEEAVIAKSVESIGLCAFDYAEGTKTSVSSITSDFIFTVKSNASTVKAGDEFTISVILNADFKDITTVQTVLVYDDEKIVINKENAFDKTWLESVDENNIGYISSPLYGFVANTVRVAYASSAGNKIDSYSPLYAKGKTDVTIAKITCKALCDIKDINTEHFIIKESEVLLTGTVPSIPACSEIQLTCTTKAPMKQITLKSESAQAKKYASDNLLAFESISSGSIEPSAPEMSDGILVYADGKKVEFADTKPYAEDSIVMIPIRAVYEAVGASVMWDNDTKTVFVAYGNDFFAMQIGKATMFKTDGNLDMDKNAQVKDSRTVVPVSVFANAFGFKADYNKATGAVTITTK